MRASPHTRRATWRASQRAPPSLGSHVTPTPEARDERTRTRADRTAVRSTHSENLIMSVQRSRRRIARGIAALVVTIAALGSIPKLLQAASLITVHYTAWTNGHGFIAHTDAVRPLTLQIDSDVYGYASYYNVDYGVTSLEINTVQNCDPGTWVTVYSQHSAFDPANSDYDWQDSGVTGYCTY